MTNYASADVNVSGGGGISVDDLATDGLTGSIYLTVSSIRVSAFAYQNISGVDAPSVLDCRNYAFRDCSKLITANFSAATTIGNGAFQSCSKMTTANFPAATLISSYAFQDCYSLANISFPAATSIGSNAFYSCIKLATASFPAATSIGNYAFQSCIGLTTVNLPVVATIGNYVFRSCYMLTELHLDEVPSVPRLGPYCFMSTPIGDYSTSAGQYGSVFVPASLYESFLADASWSSVAHRIVSV